MPHDEFDVIVIGAGAAGLGASLSLAENGLTHVVLEARERPGGRAWTVTAPGGEALDLGCEWLHSADNNTLVAVAEAQGRKIDRSPPPWAREDAHLGPHRARMAAFGAAMGRFRARVEAHDPAAPDLACAALLDPDESFNPLIDAVSTYYSGAELDKISVADLAAYDDSGINWRVRGGYGAVFEEMAAALPVRYGVEVRTIDHSGRTLIIETNQGALRARAVVTTLPSDVIAQTPDLFRPRLADKTEAAGDLPLGLANKLFIELLAPQDFPADSRAFGDVGRRATGAYHIRPQGRPLIEGFFGGECAEALERGDAAWDFARSELAGVFGAGAVGRMRPLRFHGWRTDPWSRGAYSYAKPGKAPSRLALAAPVDGRLFFAGEACSHDQFSTAHGAFDTGRRAARAAAGALGARVNARP